MKKIAIVYNSSTDSVTAGIIDKSLCAAGYETLVFPLDDNKTIEDAYKDWGSINLVISINLAGFSYRSSGDNSVYATLDYNSIHYIDRDVEDEGKLLSGLITITMKFLTDSMERSERIEGTYRRIHDVSVISDIEEDIVKVVDGLDWRKG